MEWDEPKCCARRCKHFIIRMKSRKPQKVGEMIDPRDAYFACEAFPDWPGIPGEILYGNNPHTDPYPGDHGIRYEKGEMIDPGPPVYAPSKT